MTTLHEKFDMTEDEWDEFADLNDGTDIALYQVKAEYAPDSVMLPAGCGGCRFYEIQPRMQIDRFPNGFREFHARLQEDHTTLSHEADSILVPEGWVPDETRVGDVIGPAGMISAVIDKFTPVLDALLNRDD